MCCFSRNVERVSGTRIFARSAPAGAQFLVYGMSLQAKEDLAMILPLPVPPRPPEDAVRFISLEECPLFFGLMAKGFENEVELSADLRVFAKSRSRLEVHEVGAYEASFVPTVDDFDRLEPRFRLPRDTWDRIPLYRDFGFAVFKLKDPGTRGPMRWLRRRRAKTYHPMAFEFPRRDPRLLFFPTVHIHDGAVHPTARFDHVLYCQSDPAIAADLASWSRSLGPARDIVYEPELTAGLLDPAAHCHMRAIKGELPNRDIVLGGAFALDGVA